VIVVVVALEVSMDATLNPACRADEDVAIRVLSAC
jgi:hypothetical protein